MESLPGSVYHSPDGTWWGANQSKVVRFGARVFTYVIHNEASPNSRFTVYMKQGDGPWTGGASFPTTRPGNILVDSRGALHAFVFEGTAPLVKADFGRLKHYWFPSAVAGDITDYRAETVIENDGSRETVNIRTGAAIGADDTLAVGFGLNAQEEQLWFKRAADQQWTQCIVATQLGHELFYPYVIVKPDGFGLFATQADFVGVGQPNPFQFLMYFEGGPNGWTTEMIVDYRDHPLAATRPQLTHQRDILLDSAGNLHLLYDEYLRPDLPTNPSAFKHLTRRGSSWDVRSLDLTVAYPGDIGWTLFVEVDGHLYLVATSWRRMYLYNLSSLRFVEVPLPDAASGLWAYLAAPRGGTRRTESYVDVVLLNADAAAYPNGPNYYVRIPKATFLAIP